MLCDTVRETPYDKSLSITTKNTLFVISVQIFNERPIVSSVNRIEFMKLYWL